MWEHICRCVFVSCLCVCMLGKYMNTCVSVCVCTWLSRHWLTTSWYPLWHDHLTKPHYLKVQHFPWTFYISAPCDQNLLISIGGNLIIFRSFPKNICLKSSEIMWSYIKFPLYKMQRRFSLNNNWITKSQPLCCLSLCPGQHSSNCKISSLAPKRI